MAQTTHLIKPILYYPANQTETRICKKSPDGRHQFTVPAINCDWCGYGGIIVGDEVLYVPTEKGLEYHLSTKPNLLFWGGRGSAKSTTGRWDAHMRALAHPGFKYVILRKTFPELDKTHLHALPKEIKMLGGTYNQTKHIAHYPNGSTGFFSHCANENDVLNLLGGEFYLAFFDEITTFEWEHFSKLAASIRVPVGSGLTAMVRAATNPLGPSAMEVQKYWVEHTVDYEEDPQYNAEDWCSIKANLEDNPYLDADQYKKRFSTVPAHVRRAWLDGEFSYENALFELIPTLQGKPYHVVNDIDLPRILKDATVYRAIDAGWFPDPTVVLWIAHLGNRHIVFNEMIRYKHTAPEIAELIREEDRRLGVTKVAMTFCDPSMDINTTADVKTIREIYEDNGIPMENSINKRDMYATVIHQALAEQAYEGVPRLQFYHAGPQGCPYLVKTIPQMRFDLKRPSFMADHKDDHAVVALAYYLMSHSSDPRMNGGGTSTVVRPWMKAKLGDRHLLGSDQVRGR